MPWSGSSPNQTFSRSNGVNSGSTTWAQDEAASVGITSARHDSHDQDVASGLNSALKKDGGNKPSADIDWGGYGITNLGKLSSATEASVSAASTTNVLGQSAINVAVTGAGATITSLGTGAKTIKFVRFADVNTLTHNSTSLILPGGANITTAAGDTMIVTSDASSNARVVVYQKASGQPIAAAAIADNSITDAKLRQSAGVSLIGRSANTIGNVADISAASDNLIVGRLSGAIAFDSVSAFLDAAIGSTQGQIIYRGASTWDALATGTAGYVLQTNGAAANPSWAPTTTAAFLQCLQNTYTTNTALSTAIPYDDTTPTSSEGTQILSQAITPADNTNKVLVRVCVWGSTDATSTVMTAALFRGTSCIEVFSAQPNAADAAGCIAYDYLDSPASASSQTYTVRVGPSAAGTVRLNGTTGARRFGGTSACTLTVMEVNA